MSSETTSKDVAAFMKVQLNKEKDLYQEDVVYEIESRFGSDFVYENENGDLAIDRKVLEEFKKITPNVVWVRGERLWRFREKHDEPGARMQD